MPIDDYFYKSYFTSERYIRRLDVAVYGIRDGKQISYANFGNIQIPLPPLHEQQAIAEILVVQDRLIETQVRLINTKKQQKLWFMQKLFAGLIRLPGFNESWERTKFSTLFEKHTDFTDDLETYPLFSLTVENGVTEKSERYERSHLVLKDNAYKIVRPNNFVYNPMNVILGAVARYKGTCDIAVSGYYDIISAVHESDNGFFDSFLTSSVMQRQYDKVSTGSLVEKQRVHLSQFMNFNLHLPLVEERGAISAVLATADREIELLTQELEQQKLFKKHLMQQLLTGKKRVKGAVQ